MRLTGRLIKLLRVSKGLDQRDFARMILCSQALLSFVENGIKPVSPNLEARIRETFNVDEAVLTVLSMADIWGREGQNNDAKNTNE